MVQSRNGHWIVENDWPKKITNFTWKFRADGVLSNLEEDQSDLGIKISSPQDCGIESGNIVQSGLAQKCQEISKLMTQSR